MNRFFAQTLANTQTGLKKGVEAVKNYQDKYPVTTYLLGGLSVGALIGAAYLGFDDYLRSGFETVADAASEQVLDVAGFALREAGVLPIDIPPVIDLS